MVAEEKSKSNRLLFIVPVAALLFLTLCYQYACPAGSSNSCGSSFNKGGGGEEVEEEDGGPLLRYSSSSSSSSSSRSSSSSWYPGESEGPPAEAPAASDEFNFTARDLDRGVAFDIRGRRPRGCSRASPRAGAAACSSLLYSLIVGSHTSEWVSSAPYDDRPLPVLRKTAGRGEVDAVSPRLTGGEYARSPRSSHSSPGLPGGTAEAETLSESVQREASLPIEVFGEGLNIDLERPCECRRPPGAAAASSTTTTTEKGTGREEKEEQEQQEEEEETSSTWLFSRFSTGWSCGLHADWTELTSCVPELMSRRDRKRRKKKKKICA
ncbi:hypothetical protein CRUP_020683 [Coryphaenoides rupestris]|nr:hypothetical protein CRUP_020683 [Coryphaenoides rupestris]